MILGEKGFRLTDILIDFRAFHRISQEGPPAGPSSFTHSMNHLGK